MRGGWSSGCPASAWPWAHGVCGSSGGAVVGLALVTAHLGQVRALVAHEPPVVQLLSDSVRVRAPTGDIYETYPADRAEKAMRKFMAHAGLGGT
jgi:hypothetical protein